MREKLIEILRKPIFPHELVDPIEAVADYLLDSGVTIATDNNAGDKLTPTEPKWIPVTERLPEEEGWYLVYTTPNREHKSINKAMFCKGDAWGDFEPYWRGAGGPWANVTHWMPLPEPPKEV